MKQLLLIIILTFATAQSFAQRGSEGVGGGDMCENRIKDIRDDLASWIQRGGHTDLKFSGFQTADLYKHAMLTQLGAAKIQCISEGHREHPIMVNGVSKVCKFSFSSAGSTITCDRKPFLELDESAQYTLIHHEYAGLSQMEMPNGADSTYHLSNQISSYLETKVVKFLAVKKYEAPYELSTTCIAEATKAGQSLGKTSFKIITSTTREDKLALYNNEVNRAEVGPYTIAFEVNPFGTISSGTFRETESLARKVFRAGRTKVHLDDLRTPSYAHGTRTLRTYKREDEVLQVSCGEANSNLAKPAVSKPLRAECSLEVFVDGIYNYPKDKMTVEANSTGKLAVAGYTLEVRTTGEAMVARLTDVKGGQSAEYATSYLPAGAPEEYALRDSNKIFDMKASCKVL